MANKQRKYPPEFRRQMVELVRAGRKFADLEQEFGCTGWSIRQWVKQAERDAGRGDGGLTSEDRQELSRLRRENRQLKLEREILSKAAARFLRKRAPRHRSALRIREGKPGPKSGGAHVPVAQSLQERVLRVGISAAVSTCASGYCADCTDPRYSSPLPRRVRGTFDSCRTGRRSRHSRWP